MVSNKKFNKKTNSNDKDHNKDIYDANQGMLPAITGHNKLEAYDALLKASNSIPALIDDIHSKLDVNNHIIVDNVTDTISMAAAAVNASLNYDVPVFVKISDIAAHVTSGNGTIDLAKLDNILANHLCQAFYDHVASLPDLQYSTNYVPSMLIKSIKMKQKLIRSLRRRIDGFGLGKDNDEKRHRWYINLEDAQLAIQGLRHDVLLRQEEYICLLKSTINGSRESLGNYMKNAISKISMQMIGVDCFSGTIDKVSGYPVMSTYSGIDRAIRSLARSPSFSASFAYNRSKRLLTERNGFEDSNLNGSNGQLPFIAVYLLTVGNGRLNLGKIFRRLIRFINNFRDILEVVGSCDFDTLGCHFCIMASKGPWHAIISLSGVPNVSALDSNASVPVSPTALSAPPTLVNNYPEADVDEGTTSASVGYQAMEQEAPQASEVNTVVRFRYKRRRILELDVDPLASMSAFYGRLREVAQHSWPDVFKVSTPIRIHLEIESCNYGRHQSSALDGYLNPCAPGSLFEYGVTTGSLFTAYLGDELFSEEDGLEMPLVYSESLEQVTIHVNVFVNEGTDSSRLTVFLDSVSVRPEVLYLLMVDRLGYTLPEVDLGDADSNFQLYYSAQRLDFFSPLSLSDMGIVHGSELKLLCDMPRSADTGSDVSSDSDVTSDTDDSVDAGHHPDVGALVPVDLRSARHSFSFFPVQGCTPAPRAPCSYVPYDVRSDTWIPEGFTSSPDGTQLNSYGMSVPVSRRQQYHIYLRRAHFMSDIPPAYRSSITTAPCRLLVRLEGYPDITVEVMMCNSVHVLFNYVAIEVARHPVLSVRRRFRYFQLSTREGDILRSISSGGSC